MRSRVVLAVLALVAAACGSPRSAATGEGPTLEPLAYPGLGPATSAPAPPPPSLPEHARARLTARAHAPRAGAAERGLVALGLRGKPGEPGERDGKVLVPASYDPARPAPMILLLHGAGGSAERILRRFRERAERDGVILLMPESRDRTWDVVVTREFGPDVAFIDRALASAFERWNVAPGELTVAGFSDGASYALSLGLANGDLFTRVLAFSPGFAAPPGMSGHPRVFISHGNQDPILDVEVSRRLAPLLERAGYQVRFLEFPGKHEMPDDVMDAAFAWLRQR